MLPFAVESAETSYRNVLQTVLKAGHEVESRGYKTVEVPNMHLQFRDPSRNMIWDEGDERRQILEAEIETVKKGTEPSWLASAELDDRLDLDDGTFYEDTIRERISNDWDDWVDILSDDEGSRKAVSLFGKGVDSPCTSRVQWMIRSGALHCFSYNRSQDMMFAYPMDVGMFEQYQMQLADELDVELGVHEHVMTSAHIYSEQIDEAKDVIEGDYTEIELN